MSNSPFGTQKNFGISDSLLDAVRGVVQGKPEEEEQQVVVETEELEEKKLDPVGQEDDDVDNDGDTDSSDEYLKKRRKAIGKAMKGKKDEVDTDPKLDEAVDPKTVNLVMKYGKDDEKARFRRYANMSALRPDEKRDRDKIIAVSRGRAKSSKTEGLEEAMRVLATKGKTKVVTKGDGVAKVMIGSKEVASGDLDDGAGGWFMSRKGERGQKFFDSAKKIADFYAEGVELTEREDTAMQVARALKKMGVKPNAKEAEVTKKIPGILDKMKLTPGARRMISRDPDFLGDVFDSLGDMKEGLEDNKENPANSQHLCAKQVVHEEWGTGNPIRGMHAEPDAEGNVAWYDVMFDHGIEREVSIDEMKVTKSEMHMNHKKKK